MLDGALLATRITVDGEVRLPGLRTGGNVNFSGATLHHPTGFALNGNGLRVGGNLLCGKDPHTGAKFSAVGRVSVPSARIASDFTLRDAQLRPASEPVRDAPLDDPYFDQVVALIVDRAQIGGNLDLSGELVSAGTLRVVNARIGGSLRLTGATVDLSDGVEDFVEPARTPATEPRPYPHRALHFDGTEIKGDVDARRVRLAGQARLVQVDVQGSVLFDGAKLANRNGDVLEARRFSVGGNLELRDADVFGSVLLQGAKIGANLDLRASRFVMPGRYTHDQKDKPSVDIRSAAIARDLVCAAGDRPFSAHGEVRMQHAEIGRLTNFQGARLGRDLKTVALNGFGLRTQELWLTVAAPPAGRIDLAGARCDTLRDNDLFWDSSGRIELDDFRYESLYDSIKLREDHRVRERLRWLSHALRDAYQPGPYDQFAAMLRESGNEEHATTVQIEKQRRRYRALADGSRVLWPGVRAWSWLQRAMVGYGYRPTRALVWLVACLAIGTLWFGFHPLLHEVNEQDHLHWNPLLYTLDLMVPIVDFGHKNRWQIAGTSQWISVGLIAAGWILATTVAAGVTRMLRRNNS